jgi:hypothetical protein
MLNVAMEEANQRNDLYVTWNVIQRTGFIQSATVVFQDFQSLYEHLSYERQRFHMSERDIGSMKQRVSLLTEEVQELTTKLAEKTRTCQLVASNGEEASAKASEFEFRYKETAAALTRSTVYMAEVFFMSFNNVLQLESILRISFTDAALTVLTDVHQRFTSLLDSVASEYRFSATAARRSLSDIEQRLLLEKSAMEHEHQALRRENMIYQQLHNVAELRVKEGGGRASLHESESLMRLDILYRFHAITQEETERELGHRIRYCERAFSVSQAETALVKLRTEHLMGIEAASFEESLNRIHQRRLQDLATVGGQFPGSISGRDGWSEALNATVDLESTGRLTLTRLSFDLLHQLQILSMIATGFW